MNRHVLDQLPLWVEGDLDPHAQAAVELHLAQCPTCQEAAEDLRRSQAWLQETMVSPFEETDQDRLRRKVMDQARREAVPQPIRPYAFRPTFLAACAAALLIAALTWRQKPSMVTLPSVGTPPSIASPPAIPDALPFQALADAGRGTPAHKPSHTAREAPPLPHEEPARIDIQTSNPNVRIIWLAQAKPLPEPTASLPEVP